MIKISVHWLIKQMTILSTRINISARKNMSRVKKNECPPFIFQCILKLSYKAMKLLIDRKEIKAQDFNPVH